jgi:integrase
LVKNNFFPGRAETMATPLSGAEVLFAAARTLPRKPRRSSGNKSVSLVWSGKTADGWKRFTIKLGKTGKPTNRPDQEFPNGHWELRRYENTRLVYDRLAQMGILDALLQRRQLEAALIENRGVLPEQEADRPTLKQLCDDFMDVKKTERVGKDSMDGYRVIIDEFLTSCKRRYPEDVTPIDVFNYCHSITDRGLSPRTRSNRFVSLCTIFNHCGINPKTLLNKEQRKKLSDFPDLEVEVYEDEEIDRLRDVCDDYHKVVYYFLFKSGFRKQEAMYLEWDDVNFVAHTLSVRMKTHIGFEPKKSKERTIRMDDDLFGVLKQWRERYPSTRFVLGNSKDKPNTHWWDDLKDIVRKAGLRCRKCTACTAVEDKGGCDRWFLHKFRATYCTNQFLAGRSLIEVQMLLGHSPKDISSLLRYMNLAKMREKMNSRGAR